MTTIIKDQRDMQLFMAEIHQSWIDVDYDPLLVGLLDDLQTLHANYFSAETGPDSQSWPELAESTVARKGHNTILVDTGRLRESLVGPTSDSIRETFQEGTNAGLRYGTGVEYAQYHSEFTDGRPHVGLASDDVDAIAERSADYALEGLKE